MGFYPKHLKVRRHRHTMRVIATAALSGCTFVSMLLASTPVRYHGWFVRFPDGQESHTWSSKTQAAEIYLTWWFAKNDMWPRYR